MSTTIEAEVVQNDEKMALAVRPCRAVGLFGTNEPVAVIEKASSVATALKQVIVKQGLVWKISGKEYPRCEAWTLLGTMLGVFPVTVWTKEVEGGWEARVEARTKDGAVIGAAEAQCLKSERNWSNRDDFALRSMAQTRATAKCLRMPLGFVMTLAGFEATPAEEMTSEATATARPATKPAAKAPTASSPRTITPQQAVFADDETRKRMIAMFSDALPLLHEFFVKAGCILETEKLEDLPLRFVPVTKRQAKQLQDALAGFGNGEQAGLPYPPNPEPEPAAVQNSPVQESQPPKAKETVVKSAGLEAAKAKSPEWFFTVICPIPNRGQKRDEYLRQPDTILSLYRRMKEGDETAQKRLWGFAKHWAPGERQVGNKVYPISQEDQNFREALDAFCEWESRHGNDPQQEAELPLPDAPEEEDNVPF